jgi:hypothetical protein
MLHASKTELKRYEPRACTCRSRSSSGIAPLSSSFFVRPAAPATGGGVDAGVPDRPSQRSGALLLAWRPRCLPVQCGGTRCNCRKRTDRRRSARQRGPALAGAGRGGGGSGGGGESLALEPHAAGKRGLVIERKRGAFLPARDGRCRGGSSRPAPTPANRP